MIEHGAGDLTTNRSPVLFLASLDDAQWLCGRRRKVLRRQELVMSQFKFFAQAWPYRKRIPARLFLRNMQDRSR